MTSHYTVHRRYQAGCEECRTLARRVRKHRDLAKSKGQFLPDVPVSAVRPHVRKLHRAGMTAALIAAAAPGVGADTVERLLRPRSGGKKILRGATAAALLAVQPPRHRPPVRTTFVDATGTRRRIHAMAWMRHPFAAQADASGLSADGISKIAHVRPDGTTRVRYVHKTTAERIAAIYRRFAEVPGPSVAAANMARARGWHGPAAWDRIDDPDCIPEGPGTRKVRRQFSVEAVHVAVAGGGKFNELTTRERVEVVRILVDRAWSSARIAEFLRWEGTRTQDKGAPWVDAFCGRHRIYRLGDPRRKTTDQAGDRPGEQPGELAA